MMIYRKRFASFMVLLTIITSCQTNSNRMNDPHKTWHAFGGDRHRTHYATLDQINRSNVNQLEVAWEYPTGDTGPTIECNPVVIGNTMYITSPRLKVIALEASTGKVLWQFDPYDYYDVQSYWHHVSRGINYWQEGNGDRIFAPVGPYIYALHAKTGQPVEEFGNDGAIDLRDAYDDFPADVAIMLTSPGVIYKDMIIVGPSVSESPNWVPGNVLAYNVRTGKHEWTFHTIPRPGEYGNDTWDGDSWKHAGGANPWAGLSVDEKRGIVYAPTGATAYDFYGGNRKGKNLFANSLLALDAETGKRIWHYQLIHHGIWDYDLPAPPNLITVDHNGTPTDAVAQITKMGFVFLFHRETGEPLFSIEERPVPQSDVPGEQTWPTQPMPTKPQPFAKQGFTLEDLTDIHPEAREYVKQKLDSVRTGTLYQPGSLQGTLIMPGTLGGGNWSGAAFDPETGWLYVNANNYPSVIKLKKTPDSLRKKPGYPDYHTTSASLYDPDKYPHVKPPWGTLTAIDMHLGEIVWQIPLGHYPGLAEKGHNATGTLNLGGAIVTKGGLVFIGSTMDKKFRAFDKKTGELLWETTLPAGGNALPSTYQVNGKQYVVIAAGGGYGRRGSRPHETPPGNTYVAFTLPGSN